MKFKAPIEVQAGISDGDPTNPLGVAGYLLSSDGSNVSWVSPGGLSAETAEAIVQPVKANEALTKGDPLYIVGFQNGQDVNIVERADSSDPAKMPVVGIADADYSSQAFGTMTAFGSFNGNFDTTGGTENWSVGDIIFVKPGGGLTNIKPVGTDLIQNIAIVSRVQQNTGELEVIALGRTNDVPNLPTGRLFVGTSDNTSLTSDVVYIDDANDRVGIGTNGPSYPLDVRAGSANSDIVQFTGSNNSRGLKISTFQTQAPDDSVDYDLHFSGIPPLINLGAQTWSTNGTERMRLTSTGNVGIGTSLPSQKLHVQGNARLTGLFYDGSNSGGTSGQILSSDGGQTEWIDGSAIPGVPAGSGTTNYLARWTPDANTLGIGATYDNGTNVGIGTTSPSTVLEVSSSGVNGVDISQSASNATQSGRLFFSTNTASEGFALFNSNGTLQINSGGIPNNTSGTNRISIIGSSGNVGIGTTNPDGLLHIDGVSDSKSGLVLEASNNGDNRSIDFQNTSGALRLGIEYDNVNINLNVVDRNRDKLLTVRESGNVGIGTTSPNAKLEVNGTINVNASGDRIIIADPSNGTFSLGDIDGLGDEAYITGDSSRIQISNNGNITLTSEANNRIGIGTASPQSKLQVDGGVQLSNDTATASATKVGTFRYYADANNSYVDMCMQTDVTTYAWVNIVTNNW